MKQQHTIALVIVLLIVITGGLVYLFSGNGETITSFEECVAAGYPVMESYPPRCRTDDGQLFIQEISENRDDVQTYFQEQLFERGIDNLGAIPIEGFDPNMYLGAFPKMLESDFANTDAIGGTWVYQNGALNFVMDGPTLVTSADWTLTEEGIATLLQNLEARLNTHIESNADVDALLASLELSIDERFPTKIVYGTSQTSDVEYYERDCERRGGTFNECGTPCEPDAEICATVCAYTCDLSF